MEERKKGLVVPPFLIISITSRCNLSCNGCYAGAVGNHHEIKYNEDNKMKKELSKEQWRAIINEAKELGVIGFVIAGGEPFLFPGLIDLCEEFKDRLFLILTNGTTLTKADYKRLRRLTNTAVIVSIEGGQELTDSRRGKGVYEKAMSTLSKLKKMGTLNGFSTTITRMNYRYWMNTEHVDDLITQGIKFGVFIEYIPLTPGIGPGPEGMNSTTKWDTKNDHALMLTTEERAEFRAQALSYRAKKSIYIVHSPGDEEYFGGCVSAGRGFAHITPTGDLTPCPVSNIATHNLTTSTLREGLASPLFKEIRDNEHLLETEGVPCALFAHPKEVDSLAKSVGAYQVGK
jgi:MoaA/NifB/PqqE/SkfB family radical SAM enzyme